MIIEKNRETEMEEEIEEDEPEVLKEMVDPV